MTLSIQIAGSIHIVLGKFIGMGFDYRIKKNNFLARNQRYCPQARWAFSS